MNLFRQTDPIYPFIWESDDQPAGRWHSQGEGPVHYFCTTPDAAWAEWLRYEGITDPEDLMGIRERVMWLVEIEPSEVPAPALPAQVLRGGLGSHPPCQREAARLWAEGHEGLRAPSAAIEDAGASLYYVDGGERLEPVASEVIVLFGPRPYLRAKLCALGRPGPRLLNHVRHL